MHEALEGLPAWQDHQRQVAELEELIGRWGDHDLRVRREQAQLLEGHQAAVDRAVEAGEPVPEAPVQPIPVRSRTPELQQARVQLIEAGRRLMDELRPLVVTRAQQREAQLLEQVRRTAVADLEPLRSEAEQLSATLRAVLLDGHSHRATVELGELVEAAVEEGTSVLFLTEAPPFIHVERPGTPAGRVMVDRDPAPTREAVRARYQRARGLESQTVSHPIGSAG